MKKSRVRLKQINAEEQRGARMDGDTREEVESEVETDFQDSQRVPCLDLETLINAEEQRFKELAFVKGYTGLDKRPVYVVTQRELFYYPPFGYTSRINVTLKGNDYVINSLGFHVESGTITSDDDIHELCQRFSKQSSYKFCPGIDWNLYEQKYYRVIRYHLKSVRYSTSPFQRFRGLILKSAHCGISNQQKQELQKSTLMMLCVQPGD